MGRMRVRRTRGVLSSGMINLASIEIILAKNETELAPRPRSSANMSTMLEYQLV